MDRRLRRQAEIGAAQQLGDLVMERREPFHVQFVDECLVPRRTQRTILPPGERAVDDRRKRRVCRAVARIERRVVVACAKAEQ